MERHFISQQGQLFRPCNIIYTYLPPSTDYGISVLRKTFLFRYRRTPAEIENEKHNAHEYREQIFRQRKEVGIKFKKNN